MRGLVLWYPPSPAAALWFVARVPSSYLAGVIACLDEDSVDLSFRRHLASKLATNQIQATIPFKDHDAFKLDIL